MYGTHTNEELLKKAALNEELLKKKPELGDKKRVRDTKNKEEHQKVLAKETTASGSTEVGLDLDREPSKQPAA
jgi:hypothetical protein